MTRQESRSALWTPTFISLLVIGTVTSTSFYMMSPILSKYSVLLGATLSLAGVIAGLFSITALVVRPFGAVLVDRINKKAVLTGAVAVMGLAALGYSVSENLVLLVLFRILHGSAFAVSGTASSALIASIVPRERLGEGIGYYGMGNIIATAIGPNIGILVSNTLGYRIDFILSGGFLLVAALLMSRIPYEGTGAAFSAESFRGVRLRDLIAPEVLPLAMLGGAFSFTNGIVSTFLVQVGEARGIGSIGLYFTVMAACLFFVRPLTGKLSDRKGLAFILYPALALVAVEGLLLSRASVLWVVLLAAVAKAFGQGAAQPSIQAACMKKLDPSRAGVAAATFFIGADIGQGFGPMIGGVISQHFGYEVMFLVCAGLMAVGGITYANRARLGFGKPVGSTEAA